MTNRRASRISRTISTCGIGIAALLAVSASSVAAVETSPARATVVIKPGSVGARDIRSGAIQPQHFSVSTMRTLVGAGPVAQRPRALPGNEGRLFFATDVDGGALFRSSGRGWEQLTRGRTGTIARSSITAPLLAPDAVTAAKLADRAVTAGAMSMDAWRQISSSGLLASRPDAATRPAGAFWFATDIDGGTLYVNDGSAWLVAARVSPPQAPVAATTAQGTLAQRPAANAATPGNLYLATDQDGGTTYRTDGTTWTQLGAGVDNPISGAAGGVLAGSYPAPSFAAGAVTSTALAPDSIGPSRLQDDSVGVSEIATNAVGADEIAGSAVGADEITADAVGMSEIAADAVGAAEIADDAVGGGEIASDAVGADEIATGVVGASEIAADAVGASEIASGAVGSDELASGAVTLAKIDAAVWTSVHGAGTLGARPVAAPGNAGFLYHASDDAGGTLTRSDGAAWQVVGRARSPRNIEFMFGTWTNMPAALSELFGTNRSRVAADLSTHTQARMYTNVTTIGHTTAALCVQYSLDSGATWLNFDESSGAAACASGVVHVTIATLGLRTSAWHTIPAAARVEGALLRMVSIGGNATADPLFGSMAVELR